MFSCFLESVNQLCGRDLLLFFALLWLLCLFSGLIISICDPPPSVLWLTRPLTKTPPHFAVASVHGGVPQFTAAFLPLSASSWRSSPNERLMLSLFLFLWHGDTRRPRAAKPSDFKQQETRTPPPLALFSACRDSLSERNNQTFLLQTNEPRPHQSFWPGSEVWGMLGKNIQLWAREEIREKSYCSFKRIKVPGTKSGTVVDSLSHVEDFVSDFHCRCFSALSLSLYGSP